jgi:phospholipid/cholesterol/gamma-HCH transport system permease protein
MMVMLVLLTCIGDVFALTGGSLACHLVLGVDMHIFWDSILESHLLSEFLMGLVKAFVFGGAISVVSCYFGISVRGGAEGVGRAVNDSVVTSAIAIFIVNFLVTTVWT